MSLADKLFNALQEKSKVPSSGEGEAEAVKLALNFIEEKRADVDKALVRFGLDGNLASGSPLPASTFNDLYKFTMLPVMRATERATKGGVRCTFSVNIRDKGLRSQLLEAVKEGAGSPLFDEVTKSLQALASRQFDRNVFQRAQADYQLPWDADALDAVCGTESAPKKLCDQLDIDPSRNTPGTPKKPEDVLVSLFVASDCKLAEDRVYIEATGPWHRVTWLETTLMQAVYDALLRIRKRGEYNGESDSIWYSKWLAEAFVRCARSSVSASKSGMKGCLMTGRRTGGLPLMVLQAMYVQHTLANNLGTSSVTAHYWLKDAGVDPKLIPKAAGTHAHELSMVLGTVLGELDDRAGVPLAQVISHMMYFFLSRPQGDVQEASRKALMPMLPDTLGTRSFMKTASLLTIPRGLHKGQPVLSVIGSARQDSGSLDNFKKLMDEFDYRGSIMASEIDTESDLFSASELGYTLFGAGGFFGDSEKAWDRSKTNLSMAVKVLRVHVGGVLSSYYPVKTGDHDPSHGEGKFEADGTMSGEALAELKERTQKLVTAAEQLDASRGATLQELFEEQLGIFLGPE